MEALHGFINAINTVLWSYVLIVVLVGIGIWFTLRTKFVQVRMLPEMLRLLTEGSRVMLAAIDRVVTGRAQQ